MFPILFMEYSGKNILEFIYSSYSIALLREKKEVLNNFLDNHLHFDANLIGHIVF